MSRAELRQDAQREIMVAATTVFYRIGDNQDDYPPELVAEIRKQLTRVEKLFGYEPGSRGKSGPVWRSQCSGQRDQIHRVHPNFPI